MLAFYNRNHELHCPPHELFEGRAVSHSDRPERITAVLDALRSFNVSVVECEKSISSEFLFSVHENTYIEFLKKRCSAIGEDEYLFPSVFPLKSIEVPLQTLADFAAQGLYSTDMHIPLSKWTFDSALAAASTAFEAAQRVLDGSENLSLAICRPPGHHAEPRQMAGYCYFNNVAIASQYLSDHGRVAVLDVDYHHGNGTQHVFYKRADVFTVSIHVEPGQNFPIFCGSVSEQGVGEGTGFNINVPLPHGCDNATYQPSLENSVRRIQEFSPEFLVVCFGADTFREDPIVTFALDTDYYEEMGRTIARLDVPKVVILKVDTTSMR